jgi:transposase-like protein
MEAAKGQKTISQLAGETGVHPNQVSSWKRQLLDGGADLFERNGASKETASAEQEAELYEQIGRLKMELEWLKKKSAPFS